MKYSLAVSSWDEREMEAIQRVLASGRFTMYEEVARFERHFASFVGARHAVMTSSGSSANLIMTGALFFRRVGRLVRGDEAIVPAVSWPTTYYPLSQYGLKLKFVDIDRGSLNYDLDALRASVSEATRLIVTVNLLGNPNDFGRIRRIIGGRNIALIEDNCESLGAVYAGKYAGTFGLMGSFSTFFSHHMSTMEGGVVVTDDEELYHILLCLRAHGWTRDLPKHNRVTGLKSDDLFEEAFNFVLPGYNVRPLELEGAIGIEQLKKLPEFLRLRRQNADHFKMLFADNPYLSIQEEIGKSSWFGFALVLKQENGLGRRKLVEMLRKEEIECRPIVTGNFARNPVVQLMPHEISGSLTNAEWIDRNGLFVGNHPSDIRKSLDHLFHVVGRAG